MSKEIVSQGENFRVSLLDRKFGGRATDVLTISGETGVTTIRNLVVQQPLAAAVIGNISVTGTATIAAATITSGTVTTLGSTTGTITTLGSTTGTITTLGSTTANLTTANITTGNITNAVISTSATLGGAAVLAGIPFLSYVVAGVAAAGPVATLGTQIGDKVIMAVNLTDATDAGADFEGTVTVDDQLQQTNAGDLSLKKFAFLLLKQ